MDPDGIAYLDLGEAWLRGDWSAAYWNPLCAWILGLAIEVLRPAPRWEFALVQVVNYLTYVFALACFAFFWREVIRSRLPGGATFSPRAWAILGLALFVWTSLVLIEIRAVTPDMLASGFVDVAGGCLLRLGTRPRRLGPFLILGLALGLAYLARTDAFPIAFVFLGMSLAATRDLRRTALAAAAFLVLAAPLVVALTARQGHPTFGESGRLNYAWSGCRASIGGVRRRGTGRRGTRPRG